ncbi:MAG: Cof-type HAD-IIB family hydrolase [Streptococcaceae bacterium]|jgi:Cof subfamily protein (haloacid dehalogenase superfamily)|nr:Cof-type HAD-IIB family hydrolase [Streptococcaceae bacterium]
MDTRDTSKKIIAVDLDGTTLTSESKITDYTKEVFHEVQKKGHLIVIATGRPYRLAIDIYHELGLTSPMINFNGAMLILPSDKNWKYANKRYIPRDFVFDLLRHQQNFELDFIGAEYRRKFYLNNFQGANPAVFGVDKFEAYNRLRIDRLTTDPYAVLLSTRNSDRIGQAKKIQSHYGNEISVSAWGGPDSILEIVPRGVNKAYGLEKLMKALDYNRSQLIAFGDEFNDVEMFQFAQTGYAVNNASERLIGHADEILPWTNDESAVAHKLEELFL